VKTFFGILLILAGMALGNIAHAQKPAKIPRIGYLEPASEGASAYNAFRQGLRELGYIEGQNIAIEYRTRGDRSRVRDLATELAQLKVDVIVTRAGNATRAAQSAAGSVPVVFAYSGDPIEAGFVESLANPGKNMTGVSYLAYELVGKRIELLKEAVTRVSLVAVLANPGHPGEKRELSETQRAARALRTDLRYHRVNAKTDFDTAFDSIIKEKANALLVFPETVTMSYSKEIAKFAIKHRLPSIFGWKEFVEDGGLMSYGPKREELYRRTAVYVDKILKGRKPSDLPVELPMKFELVINLQTAKQIGVSVAPNVLARADKVIR